jgi:hypothetical protein
MSPSVAAAHKTTGGAEKKAPRFGKEAALQSFAAALGRIGLATVANAGIALENEEVA